MPRHARPFALLIALAAAAPCAVRAADPAPAPTATPALSRAEKALVAKAQRDLPRRYPHPSDAEKAGYLRFNNEDRSGAISYASRVWTSTDVDRPAQLWYDINGRLLGADYSVRLDDRPHPTTVLGINPARCTTIPHHVHYGLKMPDGTIRYGLGMGAAAFAAAGGDPAQPDAATLVRAGRATSADQVAFVFSYDGITDCSVWVLPNAEGPFADLNPAVTPSKDRQKNSSEGH